MVKSKKKRTKRYSGEDVAPVSSQPVIHRIQAVDRGPLGQWWFERKKVIKPVAKVSGILAVIIWLIVELVRLVS